MEALPGPGSAPEHDVASLFGLHALLLAERLGYQRHQLLFAYHILCKCAVLVHQALSQRDSNMLTICRALAFSPTL